MSNELPVKEFTQLCWDLECNVHSIERFFNWELKMIYVCFISLCDWPAKLAPFSQPMSSKLRLITTCSNTVSRAWHLLHVFCFRCLQLLWLGPEYLLWLWFYDTQWKTTVYRAVFNWVSKVIARLLWFCFTTCYVWLTKLAPLSKKFNQWELKSKPFATCSHLFSRAWRRLHVFASSSDWFTVMFVSDSVVIGQSNLFGLVLWHSFENHNML